MDTNLILSLIANILLLAIQTWALCGIRNKRYIFKYYTYLQNFISILVSTFFVIAVAADCMNVSRLLTQRRVFAMLLPVVWWSPCLFLHFSPSPAERIKTESEAATASPAIHTDW